MLTAHIETTPLELGRDFTFELIEEGQLTKFDTIKGDYVASITFPDTERNRNVLNHPDRFELVRDGVKEYEGFELRSNGELLIRGTLKLTDGFSGSVRGMVGNLGATQRDKLITDHALKEDVTFVNKTDYDPDTDEYCCPEIHNSDFWKGVGKSIDDWERTDGTLYEETVLQHKHQNLSYRVNYKSGSGVTINNNPLHFNFLEDHESYQLSVVSPQLFLFQITYELLRLNGFYVTYNELASDHDFFKLCIYNNVDINSGQVGTSNNYLGIETRSLDIWVQAILELSTISREITTFNYKDLLPKVSIKNWLLGLQNILNIVFVFNNDNTISIIDREARLSGEANNINDYLVGEWQMKEKKNVSLKFVQEHDTTDYFFADQVYKDLSDREDDFGAEVDDFETLKATTGSFIGELRKVTSEQRIYEWVSTVITSEDELAVQRQIFGWQFVSIDFQPGYVNYAKENEVEEIKTVFSTLISNAMPQTRQPGQTILRKAEDAPFTPRLLFYTGPGTARNHTDNYLLNFTGTNNMLETRFKKTAEWWSTRQVTDADFNFPTNIRKNLDINQKQSTRHGEFIIDRMITRFTHAGAEITRIEAYKVD